MKRRNAETGKMRRPVKRTKITEGMYGSSMLYLKFVMLWATVVMTDYMLEFRFEFLWPFWMMLRSVYDSFKYQGLAFSVFFICIALTSDMICFFFIPLQYIFFAASTYVWVQYVWYTFADKGVCLPTVAICCLMVYVEGALRARGGLELCRPLAAHCVGYPAVTLGFGVKSYVGHRLRLRRQRQVRAENEFYFQLMRDALPESALEQNQQQPQKEPSIGVNGECGGGGEARVNGVRKRNGHCAPDTHAHTKLDKVEKSGVNKHAHSNGAPPAPDDAHDHSKGSAKSGKLEKKEAGTLKEEKRKNKSKDKDSDSHKSTEQTKEQIVKEVESTKDNHIRNHKECNNYKERERERERDREREREQKEREKEREREREREQSLLEEIRRLKGEVSVVLASEAEARRALAAAAAQERARRTDHHHLKQAHAALHHKLSVWRAGERASLERRLSEERRARTLAEQQLTRLRDKTQAGQNSGESENEWSRSECEAARREARRLREAADLLQRDLRLAREQIRALESGSSPGRASPLASYAALQERAAHLERSLSAETRVKLDLLSALGDAKRQMRRHEGVISRQEKEIEELKAQMLAVMPAEFVSVSGSVSVSKLRLESHLDPNASVYTPKQLCSDA